MEKLALNLQSAQAVNDYATGHYLMRYEYAIMAEIGSAIEDGDQSQLAWFSGFGDCFRQICMNVNEYRKGLDFGFTDVAFSQYGWFAPQKFLDYEEVRVEASSIRIGRGVNGLWAYGLSCSYGAGGSSVKLNMN